MSGGRRGRPVSSALIAFKADPGRRERTFRRAHASSKRKVSAATGAAAEIGRSPMTGAFRVSTIALGAVAFVSLSPIALADTFTPGAPAPAASQATPAANTTQPSLSEPAPTPSTTTSQATPPAPACAPATNKRRRSPRPASRRQRPRRQPVRRRPRRTRRSPRSASRRQRPRPQPARRRPRRTRRSPRSASRRQRRAGEIRADIKQDCRSPTAVTCLRPPLYALSTPLCRTGLPRLRPLRQ